MPGEDTRAFGRDLMDAARTLGEARLAFPPGPYSDPPPRLVVRVLDSQRHEAVRSSAVEACERRGWKRVASVLVDGVESVVVMERS